MRIIYFFSFFFNLKYFWTLEHVLSAPERYLCVVFFAIIQDVKVTKFTCRCWFPSVCSVVGRRSASTGGFPIQTKMGTFFHRDGSGRSAAPDAF